MWAFAVIYFGTISVYRRAGYRMLFYNRGSFTRFEVVPHKIE